MYCAHCGKEVVEGAAFCAHCGNPIFSASATPQYTLTFVRYDADGPAISIALPNGETITLVGRDRRNVFLSSGTHKITLSSSFQQEVLEVSLDADAQVNLYWTSEENRFLAVVSDGQVAPTPENSKDSNGISCPRCGSHNIQYAPVTTVNSSGYSCCTGCCGGLLLGPLGLLLGMCGMGTKSTTTISWMCNNCGRQFVTAEQAEKQCRTLAAVGTFCNAAGLLLLGLLIFSPFGWIIGGVSLFCGCFLIYTALHPEETTGYSIETLIPDTETWKKTYIVIHGVALAAAVLLAIFV